MKIKSDFVTNSSSTSFIFIFKGSDKWDLYKEMIKHEEHFKLTFHSYSGSISKIDAWKVIREIDSVLYYYREDLWIKTKITPIDKYIDDYKVEHAQTKELFEKSKTDENEKDYHNWYEEDVIHEKERIEKLQQLKEAGFISVLHIGFGDNHGEVQGGDVGTTMDYEGRNIKINNDTLVIFTEQNR